MPGYEPFLLCDFHVHTRWSDGRLSVREVIDLYGKTGHVDGSAITDHILMKRDLLGAHRPARVARLSQLLRDGRSLRRVPGRNRKRGDSRQAALRHARDSRRGGHAESHPQQEELAHHRPQSQGMDQRRPDRRRDPQGDPPAGRAEHRLPSGSPHDPARGNRHVLSLGSPEARRRARGCVGSGEPRRSVFGDQPQALSLRRQQRLPQASLQALVFTLWKTLVRCEKSWDAIAAALRSNVDVALTLYRNGSWAA